MAIDPRISLAATVAPQVNVADIFNRVKQQQQGLEIGKQSIAMNEQAIAQQTGANQDATNNRVLKSINDFAISNQSIINEAVNTKNPVILQQALVKRRAELVQQGLPTDQTDEGIAMLGQGNIQGVVSALGDSVKLFNQQQGGQTGTASQRDFQAFQQLNQKAIETGAPEDILAAQQFGKQAGFNRPSVQQQQAATIDTAQKLAGVEVSKQKDISEVKTTAARTSALKTEFSTQNKNAARSRIKIQQARKLAKVTTQGLQGVSKVALARIFPGIDVSNEAALSQGFKSLALDELQKFKGPTTDFEFAVTEDITGSLGDGQSANLARLASLDRSVWFAQREAQQFREWEKAGHDPDAFAFNFNEVITIPKKGEKLTYKLIDLQDTAVDNHLSIEEVIKALSR